MNTPSKQIDSVNDNSVKPHSCNCNAVTRCSIFIHPSSKVQSALNTLMDVMAEFDDLNDAKSILVFKSVYPNGIFTSVTKKQ